MPLVAPQAETGTEEKAVRSSLGDKGAQPSLFEHLLCTHAGVTVGQADRQGDRGPELCAHAKCACPAPAKHCYKLGGVDPSHSPAPAPPHSLLHASLHEQERFHPDMFPEGPRGLQH